jgi:hypothetical protein
MIQARESHLADLLKMDTWIKYGIWIRESYVWANPAIVVIDCKSYALGQNDFLVFLMHQINAKIQNCLFDTGNEEI